MGGYEFPVISKEIGALEAFYTSGGVAHTIAVMKKRGDENCSYKTLRYPGHHKMVNFLIHESGLPDKTVIEIFRELVLLRTILSLLKLLLMS